MQTATGTTHTGAANSAVMKIRMMILLTPVIDALVVVEAVECAKDFVAQIADRIV